MPFITFQKQDTYAKALYPLLNHEKCMTLEPIQGQRASYFINDDRLITLKQGRTWKQKKGQAWNFSFLPSLREFLAQKSAANKRVFLFLLCGNVGVCAIKWGDGVRLMGDDAGRQQSWIRLTLKDKKYSLTGSNKSGGPISPAQYTRLHFVDYILS